MSEIQKLRERVNQVEGFVESGAVVLSKKMIAFWHTVSTAAGAVAWMIFSHYFG